jgi:hypothetical protein
LIFKINKLFSNGVSFFSILGIGGGLEISFLGRIVIPLRFGNCTKYSPDFLEKYSVRRVISSKIIFKISSTSLVFRQLLKPIKVPS